MFVHLFDEPAITIHITAEDRHTTDARQGADDWQYRKVRPNGNYLRYIRESKKKTKGFDEKQSCVRWWALSIGLDNLFFFKVKGKSKDSIGYSDINFPVGIPLKKKENQKEVLILRFFLVIFLKTFFSIKKLLYIE